MERVKINEKRVQIEQMPAPDLAGRRLIIAAYCYYVLDSPIMSDAKYDRLSRYVAFNWYNLHPDRQWALGDPMMIRSGGSHIKFSSLAVSVALNYHKYNTGQMLEIPRDFEWRETKKGMRYVTCGDEKPVSIKR